MNFSTLSQRDLVGRFNISVSELGHINWALREARGFYATSPQSLKEQAYPALSSGPFGNMTVSEMFAYLWTNMTIKKTLEFPSYESFMCHRLGSEGCDFVRSTYGYIYGGLQPGRKHIVQLRTQSGYQVFLV